MAPVIEASGFAVDPSPVISEPVAPSTLIVRAYASESTSGLPFLHRLPVIGYAFGTKSKSKDRTELVVFMTPRVIYDTNQILEATDELKSRFRKLVKVMKKDERNN